MAEVWSLVSESLLRLPDGGVDWSRRPFSKRWSTRRLGRSGVRALVAELVPTLRRARCFALVAGEERARPSTLAAALEVALAEQRDGRHRWVIAEDGRWVLELRGYDPAAGDGQLAFEGVSRRNTEMLKRLRTIEARMGGEPRLGTSRLGRPRPS
ncbi:MAG: hypothetical protein AB7N76_13735 [Planctomycetota bacterium]